MDNLPPEEFEIVESFNDAATERDSSDQKERPHSEGRDHSELAPTLSDFDLADYILDDLSCDFTESHSDNDSEFSFIEIPGTQDRHTALSDEDYTRPPTPASSDWNLVDYGFTSESDVTDVDLEEDVEITDPSSEVSGTDVQKDKTASTQRCTKEITRGSATNRQKKARSQYNADLMMQLFGGLSVWDLQEDNSLLEVQGDTDSISSVSMRFPSLTDLCMKKIHLYKKSPLLKKIIKSSDFPVGLNKTILSSNLQYSVTKFKLSWLLQNLSVLETKLARNLPRYPYNLKDGEIFPFDYLSNIWKESDVTSSVLIDVCFDRRMRCPFSFYENWEFNIVFATLMKIMMTNTSKHVRKNDCIIIKSTKCRKSSTKKGDDLGILHQFLKSRFPEITKLCFEVNVPYAHWARGNVRRALQAFVRLYKEHSLSEKKKLFIIGEIGRLYAMLYESVKAVKMYRLLEDCLLQSTPSENDVVNTQTRLLIIDLQNQGVLTESKARNLPSAWNTVLRSCPTNKHDQMYIEAAESLLCFHLGNLLREKRDMDFIDVVREVLQEYSKHNPRVWYHLAFLNAILGSSKESDHCYGEFIKSIKGVDMDDEEARHEVPGLSMVDLLTSRKLAYHQMDALKLAVQNPFEPLLSLLPSGYVKPMKVIWRRQFHHCHVSNHGDCCGFDLCTPDLSLRLTADSHITGDCSLIFPPISNILLNPHTGMLNFDLEENRLNPWKTFPIVSNYDRDSIFYYMTYLPSAVEIYHQQDNKGEIQAYLSGNQFLKAEITSHSYWSYGCDPQTDQVVFIHWSGPREQRAKFSLVQKMKDYLYQNAIDCVKEECSDKDVGKVMSLLQKWHRQGMAVTSQDVRRALAFIHAPESDKKRKRKRGIPPRACKFRLVFVSTPQTVGTNVLITLQISQDFYQVIIKCHDRESFMNPIITKTKDSGLILATPHSEFFCKKGTERKIQIFDCEGMKKKEVNVGCNFLFNEMTLVANNLIFIHQNRLGMVDVNKGNTKHFDDFMECKLVGVLLNVVILKNQYGIKFADGQESCLKPMVIQLHRSLQQSYLPFKISENGEQLNGSFVHVEKLAEDDGETGSVAVDNAVVLFTVKTKEDGQREIIMTKVFELPGFASKLKFLHKSVGLLVAWSQHAATDSAHREHLFQYSYSGQLLGVLPFLGRTLSSWCVEYLEADPTSTQFHPTCGHAGWYLYIQDGRQGILCVRLYEDEVHV